MPCTLHTSEFSQKNLELWNHCHYQDLNRKDFYHSPNFPHTPLWSTPSLSPGNNGLVCFPSSFAFYRKSHKCNQAVWKISEAGFFQLAHGGCILGTNCWFLSLGLLLSCQGHEMIGSSSSLLWGNQILGFGPFK